ncbi:hypothetical protein MettiDRAFT_1955 [Methanolobus tindarius DSM 2278]|uniref:Endonuclease GajA/Old nuclease/RecF-like AAA domain-containing protein n=1 Tax=Methanolobus tindarius DSM 2278 TaxID=1090322 RepID=W9DRU3_METTI|nr:AAA family ATPase [Methanolobus tindarius]ETA68483.1 hypothetical protein MettiDRAFT_1955 [Methanolobus tindarius DSM 2278]
MEGILEHINIKGLHGNRNIDVQLKNNTLIIVGENGSGKTTFLQILFYVLSGKWGPLLQNRFDSIHIKISGKKYEIDYEELSDNYNSIMSSNYRHSRTRPNLPSAIIHQLEELLASGRDEQIPFEIERLATKYGFPKRYLQDEFTILKHRYDITDNKFWNDIKEIQKLINAQIIYLPTYRRIERELNSILKGVDSDEFQAAKRNRNFYRETEESYIELVEFGMKDVENAIESTLLRLKEFARENLNKLTLGYLGDVLEQEYDKVTILQIVNASEDTIRGVLNRIDERILSKHAKESLYEVIDKARRSKELDERSKIICHYFLKLLKFQESLQEREKQISNFCDLCSEYIVDKKFVYNSADFSFSIVPISTKNENDAINLSDLSSGEKQIVSLFSHLYLSGKEHYFVIIDEPELSLSVPWQRRFLTDIHNGAFCSGLVAATHSPFIYDNELKGYSHALGEFISFGDMNKCQ